MLKFFSFGKNQVSVLVTLMVLIFLAAAYFYIYIPQNEKTVQERRFRCLQNIDDNVHTQVTNIEGQLKNLLKSCKNKTLFNNYVKANSRKMAFTLQYDEKTDKKGYLADTSYKLELDTTAQKLRLSGIILSQTGRRMITITLGFEYFIKPLLPADVFDNYIVFVNDEKFYETFRSGFSYEKKDSLLQIKNAVISPVIRSLKVGGTDYKFFLQPFTISGKHWIVAGLVSNTNYLKERSQLPLWLILLLLTTAITLIVSLPWVKLYHMGNKDKLTVSDGISSVLVSMVLMSLMFFVFFKYSLNFSEEAFNYAKKTFTRDAISRNVLATRITSSFEGELDAAYNLLDASDEIDSAEKGDIYNLGKGDRVADTLVRADDLHIAFQRIFWVNDQGIEINNWTNSTSIVPHSDIHERAYFKNAINDKLNRTGKKQFYLDQVISNTTGVFTSIMAKKARPSKNNRVWTSKSNKDDTSKNKSAVVVMAFDVKSLDSVVMPDGYQFAIINDTGKVLYHYMPARNLTENLKNELADSNQLVSCIQAKSDTTFAGEYFGKQYNIKIKPFDDLPYYTVVFEDLEYNNVRDTEAYVFTLSMLSFMLIFLIIQTGVVFFVSSKRSVLKKQMFDTSWVGPKTTSHDQYNLAILANIATILLLVCFFNLKSFLEYIYIILFSITSISIFLNGIFAKKYRKYKRHFKMLAIYSLLAFVLVIDIAAHHTLEIRHFWRLLLYELLLLSIYIVLFFSGPALLAKVDQLRKTRYWTYTHSFALMTITRLIITSGIPVAYFFIYSFNYEQNLDTRYKQLKFAKDLTHKVSPEKLTSSRLDSIANGSLYTSGIYYDSLYIRNIKDSLPAKTNYLAEDFLTSRILSSLRFNWDNITIRNKNMNYPAVDSTAFFDNLTIERNGKNSTRTCFKIGNNKHITLTSANINYTCPRLFFLYLFFVVVIFYFIIHKIIRKLFALDMPLTGAWKQMDKQLVLDNQLNKCLFIVGSPGACKLSNLKKQISAGLLYGKNNELLVLDEKEPYKNNVYIADMILISSENGENDIDWKRCKREALKDHPLVILDHFEYNIKDVKTNSIKLDLLELLVSREKSKIIIISTVHPVAFLDSYNQEQSNPMPENELERWHVLLGHFRIVIKSLESAPINATDFLERIIMEETQHTDFLNEMQAMALSNLPPSPDIKEIGSLSDSMIFKLQLTSQCFYTYIWQSLTKEEKFLLYDLAEDGLVNPYDDYNLSILICKGLIVKPRGTLMIFNRSFRNFILTAIGDTEVNRIKAQVKDNGNWGNLKAPINLAILAILVFLFASQQEAYSRIITYITALSAGVPTILKVFSLFGGSSAQKKS